MLSVSACISCAYNFSDIWRYNFDKKQIGAIVIETDTIASVDSDKDM